MTFEPTWIGLATSQGETMTVQGATRPWSESYPRSMVLVLDGDRPLGWTEVVDQAPTPAVVAGSLPALLEEAAEANPSWGEASPPTGDGDLNAEAMTIVVCTRERPEALERCLERLDAAVADDTVGPPTRILVVDNAPRTGATAAVVWAAARSGIPVDWVVAPEPGLSRARNVGLRSARTEIVVFTDDDVLVDQHWLRGFRRGFARNPGVAMVTGLVPAAELETEVQARFNDQVQWSRSLAPARWQLHSGPGRSGAFPYAAGHFGTGAAMAVRRRLALDLGGFDEGLGAGTRSRGGEDLEMFVRVLRAGHQLAFEPSAIAWHVHRRDDDAFRRQVFAYGSGLAAYVTALLLQPGRVDLARGATAAARQLGRDRRQSSADRADGGARGTGRLEVAGLAWGTPAYLLERLHAARRAPGHGGGIRRFAARAAQRVA